jgi:UDP-glucose 4-epimerase
MVRAGVKRFVFSSTAAVYGDPEDVPIPEEHPKRPINPYGLSKRMVEQMLEWFDRAYGLRYVALRYFNACGATEVHGEDHEPESHLIPNILMAATGDRPAVQVFGTDYDTPDGTCIRDYVHVADLIGAHLLAMRHLREDGASGVFNLGSEAGFSVLEIIEAVRRVTGHEVPVEYGPRRSGDADRLIAASGRARETLGWRPERSDIDIIIRDAYAWRQTHPRGYGTEPS